MARDPERIEPFLRQFANYWKANPDLRFGQIVENTVQYDLFYVEDDEFLKRLWHPICEDPDCTTEEEHAPSSEKCHIFGMD